MGALGPRQIFSSLTVVKDSTHIGTWFPVVRIFVCVRASMSLSVLPCCCHLQWCHHSWPFPNGIVSQI